ncbi:hypothetical protein ID866_7107 [Astraeus odoratus]|nr:hypothetical protein ID866_7107 [Astraeus odoratus]
MNAIRTLAPVAVLVSALLAPVQGSVYVTNPVQGSVCHGGQDCPVQWVDNGEAPLLSDIGTASVGLYTGEYVLCQTLPSVDVSSTSSFTFTPDPSVGPNGQYYLVFSNTAINYVGFSGSFTLDDMTGTTPGGGGGASSTPIPTASGNATTTTSTETSSVPSGSVVATTATGTETTTYTGTTTITTATTATSPATSAASTTIVTTSGSTTLTITTTHSTATTTTSSPSTTTSSAAFRADSSNSLAMAFFLACAGALAL